MTAAVILANAINLRRKFCCKMNFRVFVIDFRRLCIDGTTTDMSIQMASIRSHEVSA